MIEGCSTDTINLVLNGLFLLIIVLMGIYILKTRGDR